MEKRVLFNELPVGSKFVLSGLVVYTKISDVYDGSANTTFRNDVEERECFCEWYTIVLPCEED